MVGAFQAQGYFGRTQYLPEIPVACSREFDFYRCVEFSHSMYGKTVSELHAGNLRLPSGGRYSSVFGNQRLSYWSSSAETAKAEIRKHGASSDVILFKAYDDATSTWPTLMDQEPLVLVDARDFEIQAIIDKVDNAAPLNKTELELLRMIKAQDPDCLVYKSHARAGGENYLFYEKGFNKLALREVRLSLNGGRNRNSVACAVSSDYLPVLEAYGCYFSPIARIGKDLTYPESSEYRMRKQYMELSFSQYREHEHEQD